MCLRLHESVNLCDDSNCSNGFATPKFISLLYDAFFPMPKRRQEKQRNLAT
jgi:hypothetical protein